MEMAVDTPDVSQLKGKDHRESWYRWVVIALVAMSQVLIGLANNAVIPL